MSKKVFISHSTKDVLLAEQILEYLEGSGIPCFIAPRDIRTGMVYGEEIIRGIDESDVMILIASKNSFESQHVLREIERAVNRKMTIIVYKIDDTPVPSAFEYFIMLNQWLDASVTSRIVELPDIINGQEKLAAESNASSKDKKKTSHLLAGIVAAALVVITVVVVLFVFVFNKSDSKTDEDKPATNQTEVKASDDGGNTKHAVGDTFTMGQYNGKPIEWVVLNFDQENHMYVIAKDIISLKPYDCAKSGQWNKINETTTYSNANESSYTNSELINAKGSNEWKDSVLRKWLNSSEVKVDYGALIPGKNVFYDDRIAFDKEAGFLQGFTEEEKNSIVKTDGDYVFLPSVEEVQKYIIEGNVMFPEAKPTKEALAADATGEIEPLLSQYGGNFAWMTRTKDDSSCYKLMYVLGNDYTTDGSVFYSDSVGYPRGVRPVMVVDIR